MRYPISFYSAVVIVGITAVISVEASGESPSIRPPLIEYLKLNTESLGGFGEVSSEPVPELEINSFAFVSVEVNDNVRSVNGLIEKIRPYSYVIRAQVKRTGSDNFGWQELRVTNPFTRFLTSDTGEALTESGFDKFELRRGVFDTTPYLRERTYVTVIDGGIFDKWIDVENDLKSSIEGIKKEREEKEKAREDVDAIKAELAALDKVKETIEVTPGELAVTSDTGNEDYRKKLQDQLETLNSKGLTPEDFKRVENLLKEKITEIDKFEANKEYLKDYLSEIKTIFRFNAANCYIRDENGNSVNFSAEDGDELRIQIFRIDPLIKYDPSSSGEILYPESELYFTFRDYGWRFHTSPAAFFCAEVTHGNFNAHNFDLSKKELGFGGNIYLTHTGPGSGNVFNYLPSLAVAVVGYYDEGKPAEGTPSGTLVENYNEPKFSAGISYPVVPGMNRLRDIANFTLLFYDLDLKRVLFGINFSPNIDLQSMFSRSENPVVMGGGKTGESE